MKTVAYLVLLLAAGLPQTSVQVDVRAPAGITISSDRNFAVLHGNSQIPRGIFDFYTELLNSA